jgi:hypothetical protein
MPSIEPRSQGWKGNVLVGLQQQRIEEQHAELAISGPGLALAQLLERADVYEQRLRATKLDVVGRRVFEAEPGVECCQLDVELQQRRVAEHSERPLIGVGDERDALVPEDRSGVLGEDAGGSVGRFG